MARAPASTDSFTAVAEPTRRRILGVLAQGERPVNDLVEILELGQPQVSKHLRVLREVGLVDVHGEGRQRIYRLNDASLEPIRDWLAALEQAWTERFEAMDKLLDGLRNEEADDGSDGR